MNQHELNLEAVAQYIEQNQQLRDQLTAEREKVAWKERELEAGEQACVLAEKIIQQLRQQLAAERERLLDCDAVHEKGYEQGYGAGWEACDNEAKVSAGKPHDWQYEMEQLQRQIERLEQQLAAAVEAFQITVKDAAKLEQQLAAAIAKVSKSTSE